MEAPKPTMEYRFLGPTGLKVSCVSYGNWLTSNDPTAEQTTIDVVAKCFELGINFFDTAEIYGLPDGQAEVVMGKALKKLNTARENLVISTKLFKCGPGVNSYGLSRKHVIEGMNNCLKRLQLDYVDVVFCHRHDHETPMEEICKAFNHLIENNKAFYWGTSEWSAEQIVEAYAVCDRLNLIRPIVEQPQYSMLVRDKFECEFGHLFDKYKMGSTIWSPLAGGLLTGKYNNGEATEGRFSHVTDRSADKYKNMFNPENKEKSIKMMTALADIAKELGCTQSQLSLAWTLKNKDVSTAIFGATKISQVEDNVKAVEVYKKITPEIEAKIEELLNNRPKSAMNWKKWSPFPPRR
jgi:voltage-dependent potassium channel beta subunit